MPDNVTLTTGANSTGNVIWHSGLNNPSSLAPVQDPDPISETRIGGILYQHNEPIPNAWIRFWQKHLLGIEWKDLRPENKLKALGELK